MCVPLVLHFYQFHTSAYVTFLEKRSYETGDSLTQHFHCLVLYTYFSLFPEPISFL